MGDGGKKEGNERRREKKLRDKALESVSNYTVCMQKVGIMMAVCEEKEIKFFLITV